MAAGIDAEAQPGDAGGRSSGHGWRSTITSSGTPSASKRGAWSWVSGGITPNTHRVGPVTWPRQRATIGVPPSSAWNSPTCHWRASSHSASAVRAARPAATSLPGGAGSMRDQLVTDGIAAPQASGAPMSALGSVDTASPSMLKASIVAGR